MCFVLETTVIQVILEYAECLKKSLRVSTWLCIMGTVRTQYREGG